MTSSVRMPRVLMRPIAYRSLDESEATGTTLFNGSFVAGDLPIDVKECAGHAQACNGGTLVAAPERRIGLTAVGCARSVRHEEPKEERERGEHLDPVAADGSGPSRNGRYRMDM